MAPPVADSNASQADAILASAAAAPRPNETGDEFPRVFGRYLLLKRLSRGGMGEIFLAKLGEIEGFEKLVIIKKILPNLAADQEFIKRFIDEAQVAIKLNHANIAPVTEVGRVDGEYFLAIEYVEGRDLRRLIARQREEGQRMSPETCLFVGREMAAGLAYAHRRTNAEGQSLAVVHCDISPPNVMVSFEGEIKIIDFGIAKSAIRIAATNPNMGFGKFGYMAPEQVVRGGIVDKRTDIYAAGVVVYELLTGQRLHQFPDGADYRQIARIVTAGKVVPPSVRDASLDPSIDPIIMKALATRASDRYQTAEEFRDALQVKLMQLCPTFSTDTMAAYVKERFREDILEEKQLVASLKAVDVAPYQEELTAATTQHTVTFARAGIKLSALMGAATDASALAHHTPTFTPAAKLPFLVKVVGASVVGAIAMLAILGGSLLRRPPPIIEVQTPPAVTPSQPPSNIEVRAPEPTPPGPTITPLPTAPTPKPRPTANGTKPNAKREPEGTQAASPATKPKGRKAGSTPEAVEEKFRAVRKEYTSFRNQYGPVLEERWQAIANEITFGRSDGKTDKYERVDTMLDGLRKEMGKVKDGG